MLFYDPMDIDNLISGSSAFSKSSLNIWKFMVHVLLNPGLDYTTKLQQSKQYKLSISSSVVH